MENASMRTGTRGLASVGRLGGLAIIIGLGIHIVLNGVLKEFPPEDPTLTELQAYLASEAGAWMILGFSVAGWRSGTLPRWLAAIGLLQVVAGMLTGVFVVSILSDGPATVIVEVASIAGLVWFLCAGVYFLIRRDGLGA